MKIVKCKDQHINVNSIESFSVYYNDVKLKYCLLINTIKNKYHGFYFTDEKLAERELSSFCDFLLKESDGIFLLKI